MRNIEAQESSDVKGMISVAIYGGYDVNVIAPGGWKKAAPLTSAKLIPNFIRASTYRCSIPPTQS